jgi:hypothetical protein
MAATQIQDIYDPIVFADTIDEVSSAKNAFIQSGVITEDPILDSMAAQGGTIGELPHFGALADDDHNISSDDPAVFSTPKKIEGQKLIYRVAPLNQSWSTMDLARDLAAKDPAVAITSKIGTYWATVKTKRLLAGAIGILADNVANDSSDMVYSVATDDALPITAAEQVSGAAIITAMGTAGDRQDQFGAIAVHSTVYTRLKTLDLIDYLRDSDGKAIMPMYMGLALVVDDAMPAVMGTTRITYTSILFGLGAVAHGNGRVAIPSELERIPSSGNGGGQEVLYSRMNEILMPYGFSFTSSSVAGTAATLAELKLAANWDRVWERKNIPLAFLQTNG